MSGSCSTHDCAPAQTPHAQVPTQSIGPQFVKSTRQTSKQKKSGIMQRLTGGLATLVTSDMEQPLARLCTRMAGWRRGGVEPCTVQEEEYHLG